MNNKNPTNLVQKWLDNLCLREMQPIIDFYHENAILVPTLSKEIRQGTIEIKDYFIDFLGDHPNLCGDIVFEACQEIEYSVLKAVSVSGIYNFTWDSHPEFTMNTLTARFTFVFTWVDCDSEDYYNDKGSWKILTHHSSAMPSED